MRTGFAAIALAAIFATGCVVTIDGLCRLGGPNDQATFPGTSLPVGAGEQRREVTIDRDQGLVCSVVDEPIVRESAIDYDSVHPNGFMPPVAMITALEGGTVGVLAAFAGSDKLRSPWLLVPVGLDVAWGIYRIFTIRPTIRHATVIRSAGEAKVTSGLTAPCPPGTEVALTAAGGAGLVAHVAAGGRIDPSELPALVLFLDGHAEFKAAGARLDASAAPAFVAAARRREQDERPRAAADVQRVPAAPPPGPETAPSPFGRAAFGPRAAIRWQPNGPPLIYGVVVDFPIAAVCRDGLSCPAGQRCADRGDGVPLCFGPGALHPFCASGDDCASRWCARRPDGVGVCR